MKIAGLALLLIGMSGAAMATDVAVPEIDGASATSAIFLLSGALLLMKNRWKK